MSQHSVQHVLWLGKSNDAALELHDGGENLSLADYDAITRVVLRLQPLGRVGQVVLDSSEKPSLFSWGGDDARVLIRGGALSSDDITPGYYRGRVSVYAADAPNGIVWLDLHQYSLLVRE